MTGSRLPDGVAPDNQSRRAKTGGAFSAPDMAVPKYREYVPGSASGGGETPVARGAARGDGFEDDNGEAARNLAAPGAFNNFAVMLAVIALIVALGAIFFVMNRNSLPYCSSQPEWNQYNCQAG